MISGYEYQVDWTWLLMGLLSGIVANLIMVYLLKNRRDPDDYVLRPRSESDPYIKHRDHYEPEDGTC